MRVDDPEVPDSAPRGGATASWSRDYALAAPPPGRPPSPDDMLTHDDTLAAPAAGAGESTGDAALDAVPPSIRGRFRNLRFLGRGGMGVVYGATDTELGREVAIKFVHGGDGARFLREARAQAKVMHEHICKIFDVGVADGQPYITMQLVHGTSLGAACEAMTLAEKVKVIRESAAALHEAHRLGLVHRDVKPSNILVERGEEGSYKPYLMDFGLAREAGERGETATGAVAGTPAYMAPEQARGEIRALDRRTDVYALGATLYDLLAGRTPFVDTQPWKILARLEVEDPPPLRGLCPGLPADLETIVMTCLERDPARRYDSARALGEDLQRYLDGEPILARKASLVYRLGKRVRKHRLAASLIALAVVATGVFAGYTLWARRLAAQEAQLARELGEDVKEMQLFLRYAHALPLHDVERERAVVRARLAALEATAGAAVAAAPVHYAIGRGYLALQEPAGALEHLRRAQGGYASPELEYALGRAMVELYREEMEKVPRIADAGERAAREAELAATYRDPALVHLRAASGSRLEHPAYVEGLVALIEGRHADALRLAREAEEAAPWFYEATMLAAETHYAIGSRFKHDADFDHAKMMASVDPALDAYRRAAAVGTSDPRIHAWACGVFTQVVFAASTAQKEFRSAFEEGDAVCQRAIAASPTWARAHAARTFLHLATVPARRMSEGAASEPFARASAAMAEAVVETQPDDAFAHWLVGAAWSNITIFLVNRHADPEAALSRTIESHEQALRLDPSFGWAANELAWASIDRAETLERRGEDPSPDLARARDLLVRAEQLAPDSPMVDLQRCRLHLTSLEFRMRSGEDPRRDFELVDEACGGLLARSPGFPPVYEFYLAALELRVQYATATGQDVRDVDALTQRLRERAPDPTSVPEFPGLAARLAARLALARGESPEPELVRAQEAFARASQYEGLDLRRYLVDVLLMRIRWDMSQGTVDPARFDEALALYASDCTSEAFDPAPFLHVAQVHERRAAWLASRGLDPAEDLARGLERANQALERNSRLALALATRGALHLTAAKVARSEEARRGAARQAEASLAAAIARNAFLSREYEPARREAERLLAGLRGDGERTPD